MAAVGKPVEQGRGHFGITEDRRPFAEAEVGGYDNAGAFVEFAQKVEQQRAAVPPFEQTLRTHQRCHNHQPQLQRMGDGLR